MGSVEDMIDAMKLILVGLIVFLISNEFTQELLAEETGIWATILEYVVPAVIVVLILVGAFSYMQ